MKSNNKFERVCSQFEYVGRVSKEKARDSEGRDQSIFSIEININCIISMQQAEKEISHVFETVNGDTPYLFFSRDSDIHICTLRNEENSTTDSFEPSDYRE
jgi:hypothetical protein